MSVVLPQNSQLGFEFYKDLLADTRAHQDRVGDFIIEVNKDFARVKIQVRGIRKQIEMAGPAQSDPLRERLIGLEDECDHLKYLLDSCKMKKSNLSGASSDIRLTVAVMEDSAKLAGAGDPKKPTDRPNASYGKTEYRAPAPGAPGTVTDIDKALDALTEPTPGVDTGAKTLPAPQAAKSAPAEPVKAAPKAALPETLPTKDVPPAAEAAPAASKKEKAKAAPKKEKAAPPAEVKAAAPEVSQIDEVKLAPANVLEDIEDVDAFLETAE